MLRTKYEHEDFIFVDAEFFFAPLEDNEPLGKAISISYIDKYPSFSHKKKYYKIFKIMV